MLSRNITKDIWILNTTFYFLINNWRSCWDSLPLIRGYQLEWLWKLLQTKAVPFKLNVFLISDVPFKYTKISVFKFQIRISFYCQVYVKYILSSQYISVGQLQPWQNCIVSNDAIDVEMTLFIEGLQLSYHSCKNHHQIIQISEPYHENQILFSPKCYLDFIKQIISIVIWEKDCNYFSKSSGRVLHFTSALWHNIKSFGNFLFGKTGNFLLFSENYPRYGSVNLFNMHWH